MKLNNSIEYLKLFRYLSMVELIYNDDKSYVSYEIVQRVVNQLNSNIIGVSIVINNLNFDVLNLSLLIKRIKEKNISVSLTINCYNVSLHKLSCLKRDVNQFRLLIDEEKDDFSALNEYKNKLGTKKNDVIFLFNIHSEIDNISRFLTLLEDNDFIYNISADNSLSIEEYWNLCKTISDVKKRFPLKIIQDLTCSGVIYDNLKGICPVLTSMICIGCNGEIKRCYKDNEHFKYNIFDESIEVLFNRIVEEIQLCNSSQCKFNYHNCFCGCPLNFENSSNKYCYNNYNYQKGGV